MGIGKTCSKCQVDKPLEEFGLSKDKKDGRSSHCKVCVRIYSAAHYQKTKELRKQKYLAEREIKLEYARKRYLEIKDIKQKYSASYRKANRDYLIQYDKARYLANREYHLENRKSYLQNNRGKVYAQRRARRMAILERMPKWLLLKDRLEIEQIYSEAVKISKETGIPHQVDHIVPLQGEKVSGLHVPWNLRVITAFENSSKSNKFGEE